MGKVIDLTKLDGAHSLGTNFSAFVLGDEIKEALEKLLDAVKQGENIKGSSGYTANNLFIDGRRGSGKTTILLTIKELLENNFKVDIPEELEPETKKELRNLITELKKYSFQVVDSIIDTSVNTASITFYFLSWLKKQIEKEYESDLELNEQLHKTIKIFPDYLKSCDKTCLDMSPDGDIEEKLDQSDLSFRRELFKLIDIFLERKSYGKNSFIVLFMDDLDISFPPQRIQKILTEVFMFLSHPKLIIVSAGNYRNLVDILTCHVHNKIDRETESCLSLDNNYANIAKSFLEKVFATYTIKISPLNYTYFMSCQIKHSDEKESTNVKNFLGKLGIFRILDIESTPCKILLSDLSLREAILILKDVKNKIQKESTNPENPFIIDLCFTDTYCKIKKINVPFPFETRIRAKIKDQYKENEIPFIMEYIETINQTKTENAEKQVFLIWLVESEYFMGSFFPLLSILLLKQWSNKSVRKFKFFDKLIDIEDMEF